MLLIDLFIVVAIVFAGAVGRERGARAGRQRDRARRRRSHAPRNFAAAGAAIGAGTVLLAGAALAQVGKLHGSLRDTTVLGAFVPASDEAPPRRAGPLAAGTGQPADGVVTGARPVLNAARSIVMLRGSACGRRYSGTGWVAPGGVIVTNAHVVAGQADTTAQVRKSGPLAATTPIWFDRETDVALLRAPALRHIRGLQLAREPVSRGMRAALLGFPLGGPFRVLAARIAATYERPQGERIGDGRSSWIRRGPITELQTRAQAGSSGSAVVDADGRVLTTVFAANGLSAAGVPNDVVRRALRRARGPVSTGDCD